MANVGRSGSGRGTAVRRQNRSYSNQNTRYSSARQEYISGSAVRRVQEVPEYIPGSAAPKRRSRSFNEVEKRRRQNERRAAAERNRERVRGQEISRGFLIFLVCAIIIITGISAYYVKLSTAITKQMKTVASYESQLSELREYNDEYYSQVTSNLDVTAIKQIAIGRLGMHYPEDDQTETYETEGKSYVRQYQDLPDTN